MTAPSYPPAMEEAFARWKDASLSDMAGWLLTGNIGWNGQAIILTLMARVQKMAEVKTVVPCLTCQGLGEAVREGRGGRLFCWPCPHGCPASVHPMILRSHAR